MCAVPVPAPTGLVERHLERRLVLQGKIADRLDVVRERLSRRKSHVRMVPAAQYYRRSPTTASISTFMPGIASSRTPISVLAGRAAPKNSLRTGLILLRSF